MAYGLKFTCSFQDLSGLNYEFQIKEKDYAGSSSSINLGAGGFQLMYGGINKGLSNYIIGSKITANMEITNATEKAFIGELASNEENHFLVNILRNGSQFWTGFMMSDLVSFEDAPFPFSFTITATDGIGLAKKVDYSNSVWDANGTPSEVYRTHSQLLIECFQKIGIIQEFTDSNPFMIGELPYWETNAQDITQNKLDVVRVDTRTFAEYQTNSDTNVAFNYSSVYDVLDSICKVWNARLFQWDGRFWFIPNALYLNQSADFYPMALNTIHQAAVSVDLFEDVSSFNRFAGGGFDFEEKIKEVCAKYTYNYDISNESDSKITTCGTNESLKVYNLQNGFDVEFDGFGDASLDVEIKKYRYVNVWGSQSIPVASNLVNYAALEITSGEYKLINEVTGYNPPTFSSGVWKRNYEHTFSAFNSNQTVLDISVMNCYTMPNTESNLYIVLNGDVISKSEYVYSAINENITFDTALSPTDVLTVVFDFKNGFFYEDSTLSNTIFNQQGGMTTSSDSLTWIIPPPPKDAGSGLYLSGSIVYKDENGNSTLASNTLVIFDEIYFNGNYNAMPQNASLTIEVCESNDNTDTTNKAEVTLKMADKGEYDSFSNLEVYAGGSGWIKSSNWSIRSFLPISHTGSLLSNVAKVMAEIQENSNLRYNGTIQKKSTSTLFSPVKGLGMPILTNFNDNLLFSSGELVASEGDWRIQLLKIN